MAPLAAAHLPATSAPPPSVLAVSSAALIEACQKRGVDVAPLLAEAALDVRALREPDARLPTATAAALWRAATARVPDAALALRAAAAVPHGAYRVVDYVASAAPTVGAAFRQLAACFSLIQQAARVAIDEESDGAWVRLDPAVRLPDAYIEYALAAIYGRVRTAAGGELPLVRAELAVPLRRATAEHARVFGCAVQFAARRSGVLISPRVWRAPLVTSDPELFEVLSAHARARLAARSPHEGQLAAVRAAISDQLAAGDPSLPAVARRLATSARSLQRRLLAHRVQFSALLAEARLMVARGYLLDPSIPLAEIADRVGFAQHSSFTRAFRSWAGCAPTDYRRAMLQAQAPQRV